MTTTYELRDRQTGEQLAIWVIVDGVLEKGENGDWLLRDRRGVWFATCVGVEVRQLQEIPPAGKSEGASA